MFISESLHWLGGIEKFKVRVTALAGGIEKFKVRVTALAVSL